MITGNCKWLYLISLFLLVFSACSYSGKKDKTESSSSVLNKIEQVILAPDSGAIMLTLNSDGYTEITIRKKERQTVDVQFQSSGYMNLVGNISSLDSVANIRFNQIIMADGTMDGPFGRDIQYTLPMDGKYTLSIGESLMAGDPWGGEFKITLQLSK